MYRGVKSASKLRDVETAPRQTESLLVLANISHHAGRAGQSKAVATKPLSALNQVSEFYWQSQQFICKNKSEPCRLSKHYIDSVLNFWYFATILTLYILENICVNIGYVNTYTNKISYVKWLYKSLTSGFKTVLNCFWMRRKVIMTYFIWAYMSHNQVFKLYMLTDALINTCPSICLHLLS